MASTVSSLCECGCGQLVRAMPYRSQARRFINGHRVPKWTAEHRAFLVANYADMNAAEMARALGKSTEAVKSYAVKVLGLRKGGKKRTLQGWFDFYTPNRPPDGCWEWQGGRGVKQNYGSITVHGQFWYAHRLSMYLHNGRLPRDLDVLHRCDNKPCVNPAHLYLGTDSDNQRDVVERGGRSTQRFSPESALAVRDRFAAGGVSKLDLAAEYGVERSTIHAIVTGKSWSWAGKRDGRSA